MVWLCWCVYDIVVGCGHGRGSAVRGKRECVGGCACLCMRRVHGKVMCVRGCPCFVQCFSSLPSHCAFFSFQCITAW